MSQQHDKEEILEQELDAEAQIEADVFEEQAEEIAEDIKEIEKLKDTLARIQADYENFKMRVERDKLDMMFYLKSDIFLKLLPRLDDLERIVSSTPDAQKETPLYTGVEAIVKNFHKDLDKMGVKSFVSKGAEINPDKHDVMTQVPGKEGEIIDEFTKGYMLGEKVLRPAKVVVGSGE